MQQGPNLIPRLVYDFLIKSGYNSTATTFATECQHLRDLKLYAEFSGATSLLSISMSPNLFDIVESFFNFRDKKDLTQCSKSSYYSNAGRQPLSAIQSNTETKTYSSSSVGFLPNTWNDNCTFSSPSSNLSHNAVHRTQSGIPGAHPVSFNFTKNGLPTSQSTSGLIKTITCSTLQTISNQNVSNQSQTSEHPPKLSVRNITEMLDPISMPRHHSTTTSTNYTQSQPSHATLTPVAPNYTYQSNANQICHPQVRVPQVNTPVSQSFVPRNFSMQIAPVTLPIRLPPGTSANAPSLTKTHEIPMAPITMPKAVQQNSTVQPEWNPFIPPARLYPAQNSVYLSGISQSSAALSSTMANGVTWTPPSNTGPIQRFGSEPVYLNGISQSSAALSSSIANKVTCTPPSNTGPIQGFGSAPVTNATIAEPRWFGEHSFQENREVAKELCNRILRELSIIFNQQPNPKAAAARKLLDELINGKIETHHFTQNLQQIICRNLSPTFPSIMKKYLPYLRYFLSKKELNYGAIMNISEERGLTRLAIPWNPAEGRSSVHQPAGSEGVPATSNMRSWSCSSSNSVPIQMNQSELSVHPAANETSNQSSCVPTRDFQSSTVDKDTGSDISASSTHLLPITSSKKDQNMEQHEQNVHPEPQFKFPGKNASSAPRQNNSAQHSTHLKELCKVAVSYTQRESSLKKTTQEIFQEYFSTTPLAPASDHSEKSMAKPDKSTLTTDEVIGSPKRIIVNNSGATGQPCLATPAEGQRKPASPESTFKVAQPPEEENSISIGGNSMAKTSALDGALETPPELSKTELPSNPESIQEEFTKRNTSDMTSPVIQLDGISSAGETMEVVPKKIPPMEISEVKFRKKTRVLIKGNEESSKRIKKSPKRRKQSRSNRGELLAENSPRHTATHRASKRKLVDVSDSDFSACQPTKKRENYVLRPCSVVLRQIFKVQLPEGTFEISR